jgi:hypothetical protein
MFLTTSKPLVYSLQFDCHSSVAKWMMLLFTYDYLFSTLFGIALGVELLCYKVILSLTFCEISNLFSTVTAPFESLPAMFEG